MSVWRGVTSGFQSLELEGVVLDTCAYKRSDKRVVLKRLLVVNVADDVSAKP